MTPDGKQLKTELRAKIGPLTLDPKTQILFDEKLNQGFAKFDLTILQQNLKMVKMYD